MTPEGSQFAFRINNQSLWVDFIVDAKASKKIINLTTYINNMPDLRINKHSMLLILLLPSSLKVIVKIIIMVLPIWADFLAADGAATSFPLDIESE